MTGGILLAHEVGKATWHTLSFTEREKGVMTLRRGFKIEPGTRVLIVEDIVTTGGSVQEVVNVVNQSGGEIVGVGFLLTVLAVKRIRRTSRKKYKPCLTSKFLHTNLKNALFA